MKVEDVMTREVVTLDAKDSIKDAVNKFAQNGISGAPVVDDEGNLMGILSETDILNAIKTKCKKLQMVYPSLSLVSVGFVESIDNKKVADAFQEIGSSPVTSIMKKDVITIKGDVELGEAIQLMREKKVNRIPVLKGKMVCGIITRCDIIRGLANGFFK